MRKLPYLLLTVISIASLTCSQDYTTSQDTEPPGPLTVARLTLLDTSSRDVPVFTDTSAPRDCSVAAVKDTPPCYNSIFKDTYGT